MLVELEIAARDQSNSRHRITAARFPVDKTLAEFNLAESSINQASHDYLVTLDWIRRADNLCLVGPAGTGKTHYLIALGRAAVEAGHRVRYFTAVELIEQLWRAVADNTVGRTIEQICRHELIIIDEIGFAPLDHTGCQLLFRLIAAAYERRSVAIASHSPVRAVGTLPARPAHRRVPPRPALPPRPHHHHQRRQLPAPPPHHRTRGDTRREDFRWPPARTADGHTRGHRDGR